MKNRIFIFLIILLAVFAASTVSAADNSTDTGDDSLLEVPDKTTLIGQNETEKAPSEISPSQVTGYDSFETDISAKLTSNGKALPSKNVTVKINGATYKKATDTNGAVTFTVKLSKGTYDAVFSFDGDENTNSSAATSKITVKDAVKTSLKVGDKDLNYRQGSKCLFYVKLTDSKGNAIKNQWVTINVGGKTYRVKTNSAGNAKIYINLKKGTYKIKYSFAKTAPYLASSGSFKIKVRPKMPKGDGYWLWPMHMKSVNLKSLAKKGTKHLFLHADAVGSYGKASVVSFIKRAHKNGMKVHLWIQLAYSGGNWVSLVDGHGKLKYSFMNSKIKQAKNFAKISGVDGIHFDYMRYGGTAHKHPNAVKSVSYFVKKASVQIHKVRPNCIVSGALMPEPSAMHYYYGQDVPTLSKYIDVLLPMVYKGNYHQTRSWIKSVTKTFVKQSNGAQIWTGLQSYVSDANTRKLSQSVLLKDAKAAKAGGAMGIVLFRIGISCNFNFKKV